MGVLAHGYFPPPNGATAAGDIHFDTAETWKIGFGGAGFDVFQVAAHEIGHAIGLNHQPNPPIVALMNPFYTEAFYGLQIDDCNGALAIYGKAATPVCGSTATPESASFVLLGVSLLGLAVASRKWR